LLLLLLMMMMLEDVTGLLEDRTVLAARLPLTVSSLSLSSSSKSSFSLSSMTMALLIAPQDFFDCPWLIAPKACSRLVGVPNAKDDDDNDEKDDDEEEDSSDGI
jgi:hypothetical protein